MALERSMRYPRSRRSGSASTPRPDDETFSPLQRFDLLRCAVLTCRCQVGELPAWWHLLAVAPVPLAPPFEPERGSGNDQNLDGRELACSQLVAPSLLAARISRERMKSFNSFGSGSRRYPQELPHPPNDLRLVVDIDIVWGARQRVRLGRVSLGELRDCPSIPSSNSWPGLVEFDFLGRAQVPVPGLPIGQVCMARRCRAAAP